ncbi:hypothetical protein TBLA_0B04210 [Henningerozyma blattae CBS 6284]|uniref:Uncharacterized protein n=1 Tax=Henningerozyma blattae (strain ATCC 34711 / CBS 6284 / DSM 70876 / NBRC 10599 / NRRL Y-10934 / UCD 77-7) TaxID=1071380 RepID=I2GYQ7_HENB6|nr:hypothetical protein TBLA_0B04210 [Tetrapisispora blattae CBS 6284]CCH59259.1 hypothetical protein TBLA_0B04210 [Tetrapisispora blattae CBS 6284]
MTSNIPLPLQSSLLRGSRLAQLHRPRASLQNTAPRSVPAHQVVVTTPNAHRVCEWGLKTTLPSRIRSKSIVLTAQDSLQRTAHFETNAGLQWTRRRFAELGVHVTHPPSIENPLFIPTSLRSTTPLSNLTGVNPTSATNSKVTREAKNKLAQLRAGLVKELRKNHIKDDLSSIVNSRNFSKEAVQYVKSNLNSSRSLPWENSMVGSGGLSYSLKGRLRNSPNGIIQKSIVPGRVLNADALGKKTAIAGFVASDSSTETKHAYGQGDFLRQSVFPFEIKSVRVTDGKINIAAKMVGGVNRQGSQRLSQTAFRSVPPLRRTKQSSQSNGDSEDNSKMVNQLLDIMKGLTSPSTKK